MTVSKSAAALLALLLVAPFAGATGTDRPAPKTPVARTSKHLEKGITCVDCHGKTTRKEAVAKRQCLTCHGDTKALAARTAQVKPTNPHENRHFGTEADCNRCHHEHLKSENMCLPCHRFNFQVP